MKKLVNLAPLFGRFLAVGLGGTIVNLGVLWLLAGLGLNQFLAALIATEVSIIHNFMWHEGWTFRHTRPPEDSEALPTSSWQRFLGFQVLSAFAAIFTLGLFAFFTGALHLFYLLAQFFAIGFATVLNFILNATFTWRAVGLKKPESEPTTGLLARLQNLVSKPQL